MDAAQTADENKTIVCGHWHTSYGHSKYEHKETEFGEDADFSPYYGPPLIAIYAWRSTGLNFAYPFITTL